MSGLGMCRWVGAKGASQAESGYDQSNGSNGNSQQRAHVIAPYETSPLDFQSHGFGTE
jgi:hypothetical protein